MRHAGDETAQRGKLLGGDEILLRLAQILERLLGALLGGSQLILRLALGDGIFAKYRNRTRHLANLVTRLRSLDWRVVFLRYDRMHSPPDLAQRHDDAARDHKAADHNESQ